MKINIRLLNSNENCTICSSGALLDRLALLKTPQLPNFSTDIMGCNLINSSQCFQQSKLIQINITDVKLNKIFKTIWCRLAEVKLGAGLKTKLLILIINTMNLNGVMLNTCNRQDFSLKNLSLIIDCWSTKLNLELVCIHHIKFVAVTTVVL